MLGSVHYTVSNTRAYLLRIATNLWIDRKRHRAAKARSLPTRPSLRIEQPRTPSAWPRCAMPARPTVIDRFVERYNARDLSGLLALMLHSASIEMMGVDVELGREGFERDDGWFAHNLRDFPEYSQGIRPRWERRDYAGESLALVFSGYRGIETLTSVMRFETEGDQISRIRVYAFCPDTVREVGEAFGLAVGPAFYSFPALMAEMMRQAEPAS